MTMQITRLILLWLVGTASSSPGELVPDSIQSCNETRLTPITSFEGRWQVQSREPNRTPARVRAGTATVTNVAGGCALEERLQFHDGYEEVRIWAFDEGEDKWQLALVDSEHGNLVVMSGHADTEGVEFITTHQRRDRLLVDRVSLRRTEAGWHMQIETALCYGAPWRLLQAITYTPEPG